MQFPKHFNLTGKGHSGGGIHAYIGTLAKEAAVARIAYRTDRGTRWKISGPMPLSAAGIYLDKLARSVMRGEGSAAFVHEMRRHQRETINARFIKHRRNMEKARELRAVEDLPTFGMF